MQVVFTIPKRLRIFFKLERRLLGDVCRCAVRPLSRDFEMAAESALWAGVIAIFQTFGERINLHVHLHFLVTEGGFYARSRVRVEANSEAEHLGKSMLRPILALERLTFQEADGKIGYRRGA